MSQSSPKGPLIIEIEKASLPEAPTPAEAPQPMDEPEAATQQILHAAAGPSRGWTLGRMLLGVLGALVLLWVGVAAGEFVERLFTAGGILGWIALGLTVALAVLLVLLILREISALARLGRVEAVRDMAVEARDFGSSAAAERALAGLEKLYRGRSDLEWARDRMEAARGDTPDAAGRLSFAERTLMTPLDAQAEAAVMRASRDVAAATALIPLALMDVLAALTCNLRMIRQIAEIYGGRAGWLGSWRLMHAVASHLIATGAVAVADDLIGPLVGGGVLAKLSRRFGEGALNGTLTARVGVAAIDICRPLPFVERDRPNASSIVLGALKSWRTADSPDPTPHRNGTPNA